VTNTPFQGVSGSVTYTGSKAFQNGFSFFGVALFDNDNLDAGPDGVDLKAQQNVTVNGGTYTIDVPNGVYYLVTNYASDASTYIYGAEDGNGPLPGEKYAFYQNSSCNLPASPVTVNGQTLLLPITITDSCPATGLFNGVTYTGSSTVNSTNQVHVLAFQPGGTFSSMVAHSNQAAANGKYKLTTLDYAGGDVDLLAYVDKAGTGDTIAAGDPVTAILNVPVTYVTTRTVPAINFNDNFIWPNNNLTPQNTSTATNTATDTCTTTPTNTATNTCTQTITNTPTNTATMTMTMTPGTVYPSWSTSIGSFIGISSPALSLDGSKVYIGTGGGLVCVSSGGVSQWTYYNTISSPNSYYMSQCPSVGPDGTVYMGEANSAYLDAVNGSTGAVNWSTLEDPPSGNWNPVGTSAVIASSGATVYAGDNNGNLFAINSSGVTLWSYNADDNCIWGSPVMDASGNLYYGSCNNNLYSLTSVGAYRWSYATGGSIYSSMAIGSDGTLYFGSNDNKVYAVSSTGGLKWSYTTGNQVHSSPALSGDGSTVYVGSTDDNIYALATANGSLSWAVTTGGAVESSPAVGSDGVVYVGSGDDKLYAITPSGSVSWTCTLGGVVNSSPAISSTGVVYVGAKNGTLYAVQGSGGLSSASNWPKIHQNNQNTGLEP
jgi:outer membrane protein assembly factor BamB